MGFQTYGNYFMKVRIIIVLCFLCLAHTGWAHNNVVVIPLLENDGPKATKGLNNVVFVALENGDFTNPVDAVNSITDASSANPYVIYIAPGRYTIPASQQLIMKKHVDIVGSGRDSTILDFLFPTGIIVGGAKESTDAAFVIGAEGTTLSELTIQGSKNAFFGVGLHYSSGTAPMKVANVKINAQALPGGGVGIYTTSEIIIKNSNVVGLANFFDAYGVLNDGGKVIISHSRVSAGATITTNVNTVYGVYNSASATSEIIESVITTSGGGSVTYYGVFNSHPTASAKIRGSSLFAGTTSFVASTGTGSEESFVSDSFFSTASTGDPMCDFVFTHDGAELDNQCKVPGPP
ncbi:MAG: hypothetical protein AAF431_18360 [Pseudomonadota bacterium]